MARKSRKTPSGDEAAEGTAAQSTSPQQTVSKPPRLVPPVRRSLRKFALERPAGEQDRDRAIVAADDTRDSQTLVTARTGHRFGEPRPTRVRSV